MKKLVFLFLFLSILSYSKTIDTVYGKKDIVIPSNIVVLEKYYIDAVKLYLAEKKAHETTLTNYKKSIETSKKLADLNLQLITQINKLTEAKVNIKFNASMFEHMFTIGHGYVEDLDKYKISISYYLLILKKYIIAVEIETPTAIEVKIGFKF